MKVKAGVDKKGKEKERISKEFRDGFGADFFVGEKTHRFLIVNNNAIINSTCDLFFS